MTEKPIISKPAISIEEMSTFCKRKGFVYSNSEIYGGMSGFFDYGPLGVEVKNNIKQHWWKTFVKSRDDVVGIDGTILSHQKVWQASGHVGCFADLMVECTKCKARKRADQLIEDELSIAAEGLSKEDINKLIEQNNLKCPVCKGSLSKPKEFNLMFKTFVGPIESEEAVAYLRPETAQQMFTNFKIIAETSRVQLPFGIAQIGRAFRNEISPRDFLFRCREFEQMELEYFTHPDEEKCGLLEKSDLDYEFQILTAEIQEKKTQENKILHETKSLNGKNPQNPHEKSPQKANIQKLKIKDILKMQLMEEWHAYWLKQQYQWFVDLGIKKENLRLREHRKDELAHYSSACFDIEYNFPFGWKEIHGMANRGSFDLEQHQKHSKKSFELFDEATKKKVLPKIIEPSQGVDRAFLAFMFDAYHHDPNNKERDWIVLKLNKKLVPIQIAVLPLVNKLEEKAKEVYNLLKNEFVCFYDRSGAIGRRYARADEIGIPLCLTIDFETIEKDNCVTLRDRDTTKQIRVKINELKDRLRKDFC